MTTIEERIKEFREKFGMWFKDFHPNNIKLMEQFLSQSLLEERLEGQTDAFMAIFKEMEIKNTLSLNKYEIKVIRSKLSKLKKNKEEDGN